MGVDPKAGWKRQCKGDNGKDSQDAEKQQQQKKKSSCSKPREQRQQCRQQCGQQCGQQQQTNFRVIRADWRRQEHRANL